VAAHWRLVAVPAGGRAAVPAGGRAAVPAGGRAAVPAGGRAAVPAAVLVADPAGGLPQGRSAKSANHMFEESKSSCRNSSYRDHRR
jgi:hypothetical protein